MMIGLLPATALAAEIELDISNGSIIITEEGYTQGEGEQVPWGENTDHALTITQSDSEAAVSNYIEVQSGTAEITLNGVNLTNSTRSPFKVSGNGTEVTVILEGENTLTGTGNYSAGLEVAVNATVTIQVPEGKPDNYGTLTANGSARSAGIGGIFGSNAGIVNIKSGTIEATGGAYVSGIGPGRERTIKEINISGGHITNRSSGNNSLGLESWKKSTAEKVTISGGYLDTNGVSGTNVTISGGTIVMSKNPGLEFTTLSITGGNICDNTTYSISERTQTKLVFFNTAGELQKNTEVTITEDEHIWTALTDSEGKITTYLADSTTKIKAKVGDGEETEVTITDGLGVVGAECTCADNPGTLTMTTPSQSLTTIDGTATLSGLAATYTKGGCVLPDDFHGDYEKISYEITRVIKNGQFMTVGQYAKIEGDTLTVYGETNQDAYTVYVRAVSGPADGAKVYSDEIAVTVNTYVSEAGDDELDIGEGAIIITDTGYSQGGTTVNWPAGDSTHALTITGTSSGSNNIVVQGGAPIITLKDVTMSMTSGTLPAVLLYGGTGNGESRAADATIVLEGNNTLTSSGAPAIQININAILTIQGDGVLTASSSRNNTSGIGAGDGNAYAYTTDNGNAAMNDSYRGGGNLVIESGTVNATGGGRGTTRYVAGIGASYYANLGSVTIEGGRVTVDNADANGAGISGDAITISGGVVEDLTGGTKGGIYAINSFEMSGGALSGSAILRLANDSTTVSITGGNIGGYYTGAVDSRALTKLYFVESNGTPKANMEVTVTEGTDPDANTWTALTDENGVITTYLANTTESITVNYESSGDVTVQIPKSHQALIGGDCSCSTFTDITWETGLPKEITLHNLTAGEEPVSMNYDVPAAQLVTDGSCNMPIHPSLPEITYELSVTKNEAPVAEENLAEYASFINNHLTLLPGNAPYTVTLTAKAGDGEAKKTVSHSIIVNKGETSGGETGTISTINLTLGDAVINYTADGKYTYTQGTTITDQAIEGTILITGFKSEASVTVNGGSPTLIINQNNPNDVWTIYSGENTGNITLQPRTFNNKLRFGTVGSIMPELGYVSAAPKLKLNPDQGNITFNNDGSVTQGKFTITALKDNEEIAIWGADLDDVRTITNNSSESLPVDINGKEINLEASGIYEIPKATYTNWYTKDPTTKTYIFERADGKYDLIAVGEGDANAPALGTEQTADLGLDVVETQKKITSVLLDSDFTGSLISGMSTFLFEALLDELYTNQCSDIEVYAYTIDHLILGESLTSFTWGDYCKVGTITIEEGNQFFAKDEAGALYTNDYSTLLLIPSSVTGDYTTHPSCTTVNRSATMLLQLDTITLGKNVTSLDGGNGRYLFFSNRMSAINVEAGNQVFASRDGILYNKEMTRILSCPRYVALEENTLVVPETVTDVDGLIFSYSNIEKVVIPEGTNINSGSGFARMPKLKEIVLLGTYEGSINDKNGSVSSIPYLYKVTVADGFTFSGDTFDRTNMEWIKEAGITVTGGDTPYDGQEHSVIVTTNDDGLKVEYSTDGSTWTETVPTYTNFGTYTVYWRITKPADDTYDFDRVLYSSRTFTIGGLEASEDWFTLSGPVTESEAVTNTPVTLHQPAAAPSLEGGYTVKYDGETDVPTTAGSYLVTVDITADGYVKETLTLGNYVILSADQTNSKVISFVTNGGEPIDPIIAASGAEISIPKEATRAGYTFAGWYSDSALRNKVDSLPTTMPSEHTTYYAKWTRDAYTITYDLDGGTATGNPATYTTETPTFTLNNPTKPGYEFTGWTWDGQETPEKTVTIVKGSSGERAYTANWEKIVYTIKYPKDYDKVDTNPETYTIEDTQGAAISLTNPAREGYSFKGWTMVIDGSISYILPAEGAEIPEGTYGNLTLSGIWLAENQTMTFHANGGKFADGTDTYVISGAYDTPLLLDVTNPTRSGYSFRGWFIDQACTQLFDASTIETMPLSMDIYAGWKKKSSSDSESTGGSGTGVLDDHVIIVSNSGELTDTQIENAVKKAEKGSVITIQAVKSEEVILTVGAMEKLVENENDLLIQLRDGEVTLPEKAMAGMIEGAKSSYEVVVSLEEQTSSKEDAVAELLEKGAVVFDVTVTVNGKEIHSFDKGLTLAFTVPDLKDMEDPMVLHLLQDGEQESYEPDEISGDTLTIKGIKNLSVFAVLSGNQEETETENPFVDVFASDYYFNAVLWAVANGVTAGTSDITFSPDVTVTRAQMVTFLWRAAGSPAAEGSNPFTDVSVNDYYYNAVLWAVANGVTAGTSATTFSPNAPVTRAQAVTFQWRAAGGPAESGESFTDIPAGAYYAPAVIWAVANGITSGTGDGCFSPDAPVSRAQAVTFLYRQYK